jgi:hypothetical protein
MILVMSREAADSGRESLKSRYPVFQVKFGLLDFPVHKNNFRRLYKRAFCGFTSEIPRRKST